ncbi:MAG: SpoIIE family protein phosphatase [Saprospiraceae bacterium]|nr:SpoIIE family protein phosphatase [Saprospiraceae bacterium]
MNEIKILAVDDELDMKDLISQKFRRKIRKGEYNFIFAHNGIEALAQFVEHPEIGLILSDINMPEMDGLTLLTKVKEFQNPSLKTIIVSAYGDMENIRTAMNRGAFDFVTKPINFDDLEVTIEKTLSEIKHFRQSQHEHDQLVSIQQDLNVAREIQQSILPQVFPPFPEKTEFEIFASMDAAKSVGGDFYDFFLIDDEHLGFVMADVSGKGVPAAIFMAVSRTLIRATALKGISPDECLEYANNLLCKESMDSMFVTVFYGILNIKTGEIKYTNAGHNPPYLIKKDGSVIEVERSGDIVLGAMEDFPFKVKTMTIEPGDTFFTFTDGVNEAMNINFEEYTDARLIEVLKTNAGVSPKELITKVVDDVKEFTAGAEQSDDITTLAFKFFG